MPATHTLPTTAPRPTPEPKQVRLIADGDSRQSANRHCWAAQAEVEAALTRTVAHWSRVAPTTRPAGDVSLPLGMMDLPVGKSALPCRFPPDAGGGGANPCRNAHTRAAGPLIEMAGSNCWKEVLAGHVIRE